MASDSDRRDRALARTLTFAPSAEATSPQSPPERGRPRRTIEDMPVRRSGGTAGHARIWLWVVGDGQAGEVNAESPRGNPVRVRLSPRASRRDKDLHTKH